MQNRRSLIATAFIVAILSVAVFYQSRRAHSPAPQSARAFDASTANRWAAPEIKTLWEPFPDHHASAAPTSASPAGLTIRISASNFSGWSKQNSPDADNMEALRNVDLQLVNPDGLRVLEVRGSRGSWRDGRLLIPGQAEVARNVPPNEVRPSFTRMRDISIDLRNGKVTHIR